MSEDFKSLEMDVKIGVGDYRKLMGKEWPVFRITSIGLECINNEAQAHLVSCGHRASLPHAEVDGRLVYVLDTLYVVGGPNDGAEVRVCGFNLEGEPIVQRVDGQPLEWPSGHRRHVLDVPLYRLSWDRPLPTLLEAARAVVRDAQQFPCHSAEMHDLIAAVEREDSLPF